MSEILCSTGALIGRANGRNYRLLEEFSKILICDGFEFMIYGAWYEEFDRLMEFMKSQNFNIPVIHCDKLIGQLISEENEEAFENFELNCKAAKELGAKKLVLHLWNGPISDKFIDRNIKACGRLLEIAKRYGQELMIENVVCNQQDPMTHWKTLSEIYPELTFIFDTKMAAFHSQMDALYEAEWLKDKVHHYHVNDYGGGYMDWSKLRTLPIGEGHIDFEPFWQHIKTTGYNGSFTLESTAFDMDGNIDLEMLNRQVRYIRSKTE